MNRFALLVGFLVLQSASAGLSDEGLLAQAVSDAPETSHSPSRWESAAFIYTEYEDKGETRFSSGSGFLLESGPALYLVTAAHVAKRTGPTTLVAFNSTADVSSRRVQLNKIGKDAKSSWRYIEGYDVAAIELDAELLGECCCLSIERCAKTLPVRRTAIEFVGFPLRIGSESPKLQPVVVVGAVASDLGRIDLSQREGIERVALCTPSIADGTSGGPVFSAPSTDGWELIGLFTGNLGDKTGAKLSKIAPASAIIDLTAKWRQTEKSTSDDLEVTSD